MLLKSDGDGRNKWYTFPWFILKLIDLLNRFQIFLPESPTIYSLDLEKPGAGLNVCTISEGIVVNSWLPLEYSVENLENYIEICRENKLASSLVLETLEVLSWIKYNVD